MKTPLDLKNRYTGADLEQAAASLARHALESCRVDPLTGVKSFDEDRLAAARRGYSTPHELSLDDYACILHLKHGVPRLYCKKQLYLADGDIARAEVALIAGEWKRGLLFRTATA